MSHRVRVFWKRENILVMISGSRSRSLQEYQTKRNWSNHWPRCWQSNTIWWVLACFTGDTEVWLISRGNNIWNFALNGFFLMGLMDCVNPKKTKFLKQPDDCLVLHRICSNYFPKCSKIKINLMHLLLPPTIQKRSQNIPNTKIIWSITKWLSQTWRR